MVLKKRDFTPESGNVDTYVVIIQCHCGYNSYDKSLNY